MVELLVLLPPLHLVSMTLLPMEMALEMSPVALVLASVLLLIMRAR